MKPYSGLLLLIGLLVPGTVSAQKEPGATKDTRSAEVYLKGAQEEAVIADQRKFYQQALEATLRGAQATPDNGRVWLLMGRAHIGLKNLAAADSAFDRAEQLYPPYKTQIEPYRVNAWITLYNQGIEALQTGDNAEAIARMEQANSVYLGRPEALTTLAQLYQQGGDLQKAEKGFRDALAVLRGPARAGLAADAEARWAANEQESVLRLAGLLAETNRTDEAVALYREFLARQPDNVLAKSNLGVVLMRAGRTAEAAPLFNELLGRQDLEGPALFNIGVGLFRASQYAQAARAFERALTDDPYSHEALYNLGQAIYGGTAEAEKNRQGKTGAELAAANEQLFKDYTRMGEIAQQLLQLDPANSQAVMMLAHSQRARGELTSDKAQAEEWKKQVLATLEQHQTWVFEVDGVQLLPGAGKATAMGTIKNLKAAQGTPLRIKFILMDKAGTSVAEQEISVNAPATGESERFNVDIPAPESAVGWKYAVVK